MLILLFLLAYCVLTNRVRVEAQLNPTCRGGVHVNFIEKLRVEICHCFFKMAVLFDSDSEEEEYIGFTIEPGFERDNRESESDISVSSVDSEDLSDLDLSNQKVAMNMNKSGMKILVQFL